MRVEVGDRVCGRTEEPKKYYRVVRVGTAPPWIDRRRYPHVAYIDEGGLLFLNPEGELNGAQLHSWHLVKPARVGQWWYHPDKDRTYRIECIENGFVRFTNGPTDLLDPEGFVYHSLDESKPLRLVSDGVRECVPAVPALAASRTAPVVSSTDLPMSDSLKISELEKRCQFFETKLGEANNARIDAERERDQLLLENAKLLRELARRQR